MEQQLLQEFQVSNQHQPKTQVFFPDNFEDKLQIELNNFTLPNDKTYKISK